MTRYKISFHAGPVSTFVVEEHESKEEAQRSWRVKVLSAKDQDDFLTIGDVMIVPEQLTFVVVEELVEKTDEPAAGATIET